MSVSSLTNTQTVHAENRRPGAKTSGPSGLSFQERLTQTASGGSAAPDHSAFQREPLLASLSDFRTSMLERMKKAKENQEEQEAWDKLMKYLDAWIESLREEADVRKIARAHAALSALQQDAASGRKDLAGALLERLEEIIL